MGKFVKAEMDGSLKINLQSELFEKVKLSRAWFINRNIGGLMMLVFAISDSVGFWQIANETMSLEPIYIRMLIVVAFTAAFEVAPLYMGYSISLKYNKLSMRIHNMTFKLSLAAFLLGITVNGIYRILTMEIAYKDISMNGGEGIENIALPMTVLMIIVPIITSLVNMIIGCLVFDPLYFHLIKLKKRLSVFHEKKRQLLVYVMEMDDDDKVKKEMLEDITSQFNSAKNELEKAKERLKKYIQIIN